MNINTIHPSSNYEIVTMSCCKKHDKETCLQGNWVQFFGMMPERVRNRCIDSKNNYHCHNIRRAFMMAAAQNTNFKDGNEKEAVEYASRNIVFEKNYRRDICYYTKELLEMREDSVSIAKDIKEMLDFADKISGKK